MLPVASTENIDWAARARVNFAKASVAKSTLRVTSGRITAGPPEIDPRLAVLEIVTEHPRLLAGTFEPCLKTSKINPALDERRGRGIVVKSLIDDGGPLFALAWHLDADLRACPLVLTMARRVLGGEPDPRIVVVRGLAMNLVLELMFWLSAGHREWATTRLSRKEADAATRLGSLEFDVQGNREMEQLVTDYFGARAKVAGKTASGVTRLRVSP